MSHPLCVARLVYGSSEEWKRAWDDDFDMQVTTPSGIVKRAFPTVQGKAIADLGCGKGRNTRYLLDEGASVYAVDAHAFPWMLQAREIFGVQLMIHVGDLLEAPIATAAFDGILLARVAQYIAPRDLDTLLARSANGLAASGVLALSYTEEGGIHTQKRIHDLYKHPVHTVTEMITRAGLQITECAPGSPRSTGVNYTAPAKTWEIVAESQRSQPL